MKPEISGLLYNGGVPCFYFSKLHMKLCCRKIWVDVAGHITKIPLSRHGLIVLSSMLFAWYLATKRHSTKWVTTKMKHKQEEEKHMQRGGKSFHYSTLTWIRNSFFLQASPQTDPSRRIPKKKTQKEVHWIRRGSCLLQDGVFVFLFTEKVLALLLKMKAKNSWE